MLFGWEMIESFFHQKSDYAVGIENEVCSGRITIPYDTNDNGQSQS